MNFPIELTTVMICICRGDCLRNAVMAKQNIRRSWLACEMSTKQFPRLSWYDSHDSEFEPSYVVFTKVSSHKPSISAAEFPSWQMQIRYTMWSFHTSVCLVASDVSGAYQLVAERNTNWVSGCVWVHNQPTSSIPVSNFGTTLSLQIVCILLEIMSTARHALEYLISNRSSV